MVTVDLADDTFIVADPLEVSQAVADPTRWRSWWPDLDLSVVSDRGREGVQWAVAGALTGSMEIWLEPWTDGVLVHHYLRARRSDDRSGRRAARDRIRRARAWKSHVHALKDELERGREPGTPRVPARVKARRPAADD